MLKLLHGTDKAILVSTQQPQCIEPSPPGTSNDISTFDVEATISNIDPMLWRMIVHLTRTITETRKNTPPDNISYQRKLQCLYCV